jgi:hypothetical protein
MGPSMVRLGIIFLLLLRCSLVWSEDAAGRQLDQAYARLLLARQETNPGRRDRLLAEAIDIFKSAYQVAGSQARVQTLIGAAQGYLLTEKFPPKFPFFWQATPLQRAEKSLEYALVLHPHNGAAALLLGLVYHRQAAAAPSQAGMLLQQRDRYLQLAASQGLPLRRFSAAGLSEAFQGFDVEDTMLLLQYIDARGTGRGDDLLLVYRTTTAQDLVFAVVVVEGHPYPLSTDSANGSLGRVGRLESVEGLHLLVTQEQARWEVRFVWDNNGFVSLGSHPPSH